jgi:mannose-6-phosphate isomerase-like protein (cupin superfamily)
MTGYVADIEKKAIDNKNFRQVLFTGPNSQLVLMSLAPGEDIGMETHDHVDQFFRVEKGNGAAILDGKEHALKDGSAVVVPAGTKHNIVNRSKSEALKLYTIYTPPQHADGTIHKTRAEAMAAEEHHMHA